MSEHMRVMALLGSLGPDWSDWVAQLLATRPIAQVSFQEACVRIRTERTRREQEPGVSITSRRYVTRKAQASSSRVKPALKQSQLSLQPSIATRDVAGRDASSDTHIVPTPTWPQGSYTSFFRHRPSPAATNEPSDSGRAQNAPSASSYVGKGKGRAYETPSTASFAQLELEDSTTQSSPQLGRRPSYVFLPSHSSMDFQKSNASTSSCRTPTMMPPPSSKPVHNLIARQVKAQKALQDKPFKIWTPETMSKRIAQPKRSTVKTVPGMFVMHKQAAAETLLSQPEPAKADEHDLIVSLNLSPATATSYHSLPRGSPPQVVSSDESELFTTPKSTLEHDIEPRFAQTNFSAATRVTAMFTRALADKKPGRAPNIEATPPIVVQPRGPDRFEHSSSPSSLMLRRIHRKPRRPVLSDSVLSQCLVQSGICTPTPRALDQITTNRESERAVKPGKLKHVRRPEVLEKHDMLNKSVRKPLSKNDSSKSELEFVYSPLMNIGTNESGRAGGRSTTTSKRLQTPGTPSVTRQNKVRVREDIRSPAVNNVVDDALISTQELLSDADPFSVQVCASIEDEPPHSKRMASSPDHNPVKRLRPTSSPSTLARIAFKPIEQIDVTQEVPAPASPECRCQGPASDCGPGLLPLSGIIPSSPQEKTATDTHRVAEAAPLQQTTLSLDDLARRIAVLRAAGVKTLDVHQLVAQQVDTPLLEHGDVVAATATADILSPALAKKMSRRRERRKLKRERARLARQHLASTGTTGD